MKTSSKWRPYAHLRKKRLVNVIRDAYVLEMLLYMCTPVCIQAAIW